MELLNIHEIKWKRNSQNSEAINNLLDYVVGDDKDLKHFKNTY